MRRDERVGASIYGGPALRRVCEPINARPALPLQVDTAAEAWPRLVGPYSQGWVLRVDVPLTIFGLVEWSERRQ